MRFSDEPVGAEEGTTAEIRRIQKTYPNAFAYWSVQTEAVSYYAQARSE